MNPVICGVGDFIDLFGKLGELACRLAALVLQHVGGQHKFIAIGYMGVDEVVQQRPLQPGPHTLIHPEAGTGQFGSPVIVDEAQV